MFLKCKVGGEDGKVMGWVFGGESGEVGLKWVFFFWMKRSLEGDV